MIIQPVRSYTQQEVKWSWENLMDELAAVCEADAVHVGMDEVFILADAKDADAWIAEMAAPRQ